MSLQVDGGTLACHRSCKVLESIWHDGEGSCVMLMAFRHGRPGTDVLVGLQDAKQAALGNHYQQRVGKGHADSPWLRVELPPRGLCSSAQSSSPAAMPIRPMGDGERLSCFFITYGSEMP